MCQDQARYPYLHQRVSYNYIILSMGLGKDFNEIHE